MRCRCPPTSRSTTLIKGLMAYSSQDPWMPGACCHMPWGVRLRPSKAVHRDACTQLHRVLRQGLPQVWGPPTDVCVAVCFLLGA